MRFSLGFRSRARRVQHAGLALSLLLASAAIAGLPARADNHAAAETHIVEQLQNGLVQILRAPSGTASGTAPGGRSAALGELVAETFDINAMGAIAVGVETYRGWTAEQREMFLSAFARFMVATHASRLDESAGEVFEIEGSEDAQSQRKIVHSRYLRENRDPVSVDYLVQMTEDGWRILDVYLDGTVSLLALHRAEFTSVLRNKGFEGFITALNAKADEINAQSRTN